jgi:small subunit ribosomal protein S17
MVNTETETLEISRSRRKVRLGLVTSDKMEKTIVVTVTNLVRHPLYGRILKRTKKFKAHDELNDAHEGDTVEIMETRPLSKGKRWRLVRVIERAK